METQVQGCLLRTAPAVTIEKARTQRQHHQDDQASDTTRARASRHLPESQGKTVRGPEDEPLGHTISLRKPSYLHDDEYKQHLYMILGRAKALKWSLFHDFPSDAQGLPEWKWFESGPPSYVLAFFEALQPRADMTLHGVELARRELRLFPLWRCKPPLELVNKDSLEKIYTYDKAAWDKACSASCVARPKRRAYNDCRISTV